jgi:hypothetical protein
LGGNDRRWRTTIKRQLLSLGVLLSIVLTGCALLVKDSNTQSHYRYDEELPLSVGNYWVYRVTRYEGFNPNDIMTTTFTMTDTITGVEIKDGFFVATVQSERSAETLVEVRGNYPVADGLWPVTTETYWLIVDDNRVLRQDDRLNLSDLQSRVLVEFVFPISLNSQWSMYNAKDAPLNRKVTKVGSITVPAGTFADCSYLEGVIGGTAFEDWFCPGNGVVWSNAQHRGTPYGSKRELAGYKVR